MAIRFSRGEHVLYRGPHVDDSGVSGPPVICDLKPVTVVEDSDRLISLYLRHGTPTLMSHGLVPGRRKPWAPGEWELVESAWDRWHTVVLVVPGEWRATWLRWSADWVFQDWYVNLQEPLGRTRWGFDIRDLQLDIVVAPNRSWRWKDEDEFDRGLASGLFSEAHAEQVRRSAREAISAIQTGSWPFVDDLRDWRPDADWAAPQLPPAAELRAVLEWSPSDTLERCL